MALGAEFVSGSPRKHLAVQVREEIGEDRVSAGPKGMSCTVGEEEEQDSY